MTDKEKAIRWFENIAEECYQLTSGNVAHLRTQIKGMALSSAEYLKKQESAIEKCTSLDDNQNTDSVEEIKAYWESISKPDRQLGTAAKIDIKQFVAIISHFAQWQKEKVLKDAVIGTLDCDDNGSWIELESNIVSLSEAGDKVKVIIIKE